MALGNSGTGKHCMTKQASPHRARAYSMMFMRRQFWLAQDGFCGICRGRMKRNFGSPKLTFDHVWPIKGFLAHPEQAFVGNLLLAHEGCNIAKGHQRPTDEQVAFLAQINRRLGYAPHETRLWDELELAEAQIEG